MAAHRLHGTSARMPSSRTELLITLWMQSLLHEILLARKEFWKSFYCSGSRRVTVVYTNVHSSKSSSPPPPNLLPPDFFFHTLSKAQMCTVVNG